VTLPVSDHVEAITWGYAGDTGGGVGYMYIGCHTDGGIANK